MKTQIIHDDHAQSIYKQMSKKKPQILFKHLNKHKIRIKQKSV